MIVENNMGYTDSVADYKMIEGRERGEEREFLELHRKIQALLSIAFRENPSLSQVRLETFAPEDDFDASGYYKFVEGKHGELIPIICISTGGPSFLKALLKIRRSSVELNAEMLGIAYENMTPELLQLFIIAHELGHIKDFTVNFQGDPNLEGWEAVDEMKYQRDAVLSMLPVKNVSPANLASELRNVKNLNDAIELFPEIVDYPKFHEIKTVGDLLRAQEIEYRSSPPESYADTFAACLLLEHAKKLGISEIVGRNMVENLAA